MTKKKPFMNSTENLPIDEVIRDDMKFVDVIPLEELKMKTSTEKQRPITENAISGKENFPDS
ncbi:hypothetical protein [Sporosarcina sp. E16_8]|uniref:hypothetical protein n=1 Tax=Sporosarcina sp. E16_8 TaxID=2789295 RepID=UPI001A91D70F|nr:hypothetical protein [Sporosarcina sp. E16_8]MBO0586655.1 hypothetical protein [Sporosarcina sp. E16_8]